MSNAGLNTDELLDELNRQLGIPTSSPDAYPGLMPGGAAPYVALLAQQREQAASDAEAQRAAAAEAQQAAQDSVAAARHQARQSQQNPLSVSQGKRALLKQSIMDALAQSGSNNQEDN